MAKILGFLVFVAMVAGMGAGMVDLYESAAWRYSKQLHEQLDVIATLDNR